MTTAFAHPNIALIKYWGKQPQPGNLPATPSLSITLSNLVTTTRIDDAETDEFCLDRVVRDDAKVASFIRLLRNEFSIGQLKIDSTNNFPTSAGLASSASGFAALARAINSHCHLGLADQELSTWARRGSASAARSIFGGFVTLEPPNFHATSLADPNYWELQVVVAVTSRATKDVGSSAGMERSRKTSDFFTAWLETADSDFDEAMAAVRNIDFEKLADVSEKSCLKMHAVMLTSIPTLAYWNSTTISCMDSIRRLRADGTEVFFTNDAGPQVKAVCRPTSVNTVAQTLRDIPGVQDIVICGLGGGARLTPDAAQKNAPQLD